MFTEIKLSMEREIIRDTNHMVGSLKESNYLAITHHLSTLLTSAIGFIFILYSVTNFEVINDWISLPILGSMILAVAIIFLHQINKRNEKYLKTFLLVFLKIRIFFSNHWYADYLAKYYWISLASLAGGFVFLFITHTNNSNEWLSETAILTNDHLSSINMLITMAIGLLAAQIALFSLMMQQVLGKYSGIVAQTVVSHKSIKLLTLYPLIGLAVPIAINYFGIPTSIQNYIFPVIGIMLLLGLFISVIVAKSGLNESLAIRYVGEADSRRIKKAIPTPINNKSRFSRIFWLPLNYLGLDFRNKDRYQSITIPKTGSGIATESLSALLGVANKAVVDGQHDMFVASLASIERIIHGYSERRTLYYSNEDSVFTYLNYQLAALIESSAKAPNQYLVSNLAASIGRISKLTYCVGNYPESDSSTAQLPRHSNNFITSLWMGLLFQNFEHTHLLTRSTAAHESIIQMTELARISIDKNDSDAITLSYLPTINKVYGICIPSLEDAYHHNLACMCFSKLIEILILISKYRTKLIGTHQDPFNETLDAISTLSTIYHSILSAPSINGDDPVTSLTTKTSSENYCIQEIFFITLYRDLPCDHDYSTAKSDLIKLIETNTQLGKFSLSKNIYHSSDYLDALFEIAYLVMRGIPEQFSRYDDTENQRRINYELSSEPSDTKRELTIFIFENFRDLYVDFYQSRRIMPDWQQSALSILGLAIISFVDSKDVYMKEQIVETGWLLYTFVAADNHLGVHPHYNSQKYLQLLGAWLDHYDIDHDLAGEIAKLSAIRRRSRGMFGGGSARNFGIYGYPTIHHGDFYLYPLLNIRQPSIISEKAWDEFSNLGKKLICTDVLLPYYSRIRAIR